MNLPRMNRWGLGRWRTVLLLAVVASSGFGVLARTNLHAPRLTLRSLVPVQSRLWTVELNRFLLLAQVDESQAKPSRSSLTADSLGSIATNASLALQEPLAGIEEARMESLIRRIDETGHGIRSDHTRPNLFDRGVNAVLVPERIRVGRAEVGFSPYTALKRRNPLCLINPIPLSISW